MINYYFRNLAEQVEVKNNLLSLYIERWSFRFHDEHVNYYQARYKLQGMIHFGNWLQKKRIPVEKIQYSHVKVFLSELPLLPANQKVEFGRQRCAARIIAAEIQKEYPATATNKMFIKTDKILIEVDKYLEHLCFNCGLSERSCVLYKRPLAEFLSHFFKKKRTIAISALTPTMVKEYLQCRIRSLSAYQAETMCISIRGYLRFLQFNGVDTRHLVLAVPSASRKRRSLSPIIISSDDLEIVLSSVDRSTSLGKRTYASILCLSDLGMRIGDVARLSLDDINWRNGTIIVKNNKSDRPFLLPLPERVGKAIADYLCNGRPRSETRDVFVSCRSSGNKIRKSALYEPIQRIWKKTGLNIKYSGTHVFRHSLATNLRRKGLSLKVIADILGHQCLRTTALYAQVDVEALRQLAQGWPKKEVLQ